MEFLLGLFLVFILVAVCTHKAFASMPKHWLCTKCHKRVFKEDRPSLSGCPDGGVHHWVVDY